MLKNSTQFSNILYKKFLGRLIKKGKIFKAKKILDLALFSVKKKLKISINFIFYQIFKKLNTFVETRRIKKKKKLSIIPFPILVSRRIHLALKWILLAINVNKARLSFSKKLSVEIIKILKNQSSYALKLKKLNNTQANLYKSNAHFRW